MQHGNNHPGGFTRVTKKCTLSSLPLVLGSLGFLLILLNSIEFLIWLYFTGQLFIVYPVYVDSLVWGQEGHIVQLVSTSLESLGDC